MQEQSSLQINEALLERFVRYPETLSQETIEEIAAYTQAHPWAHEIVGFYVGFYESLDAECDPVAEREAYLRSVERLSPKAKRMNVLSLIRSS